MKKKSSWSSKAKKKSGFFGRYKWYGRHRRFELVKDIKGPKKKIIAFNSHEHAKAEGWKRGAK
jgi:hypothetical protein